MATENGEVLTNTQFYKRIINALKIDEVMDNSGHVYMNPELHLPLPKQAVAEVQARVLGRLEAAGVADLKNKLVKYIVSEALRTAARRKPLFVGPPAPKPPRPPREKREKPAPTPTPAPAPAPTLTAKRRNTETRQVVINVTVKKARAFHYPRDLPGGDA